MALKCLIFFFFLLTISEFPRECLADPCENQGKVDMSHLQSILTDSENLFNFRQKIVKGLEYIYNLPNEKSVDKLQEQDISYENYLSKEVSTLNNVISSLLTGLKVENTFLHIIYQYANYRHESDLIEKVKEINKDYRALDKGLIRIQEKLSKVCFSKDEALLNLQDAKDYNEAQEKLNAIRSNCLKVLKSPAFKILVHIIQKDKKTMQAMAQALHIGSFTFKNF